MFNLLSSAYLSDILETPAKWLTVGILGGLILVYLGTLLVALVCKIKGNESFYQKTMDFSKKYLKAFAVSIIADITVQLCRV